MALDQERLPQALPHHLPHPGTSGRRQHLGASSRRKLTGTSLLVGVEGLDAPALGAAFPTAPVVELIDDLDAEPDAVWLHGATARDHPLWWPLLGRSRRVCVLGVPLTPAAGPVELQALPGPTWAGDDDEVARASARLFATAHARLATAPCDFLQAVDRSACARPADPALVPRLAGAVQSLAALATRTVVVSPFVARPCVATFGLTQWLDEELGLGGTYEVAGEHIARIECRTAADADSIARALADIHAPDGAPLGVTVTRVEGHPQRIRARIGGHRFDLRRGRGPRFGIGGGFVAESGGAVALLAAEDLDLPSPLTHSRLVATLAAAW